MRRFAIDRINFRPDRLICCMAIEDDPYYTGDSLTNANLGPSTTPVVPDLSGFDIGSMQDPFITSMSSNNGGNSFLAVSDPTGSTAVPHAPLVQPAPSSPGWQNFAASLIGTAQKAYTDSLPTIQHPVTPLGKLPSTSVPAISKAGISTVGIVALAAVATLVGLIAFRRRG